MPYWIQIVQAIGPTAIAAAALIITAYFASRQWITARDKLRFDLFEKRYAYFIALRDFMISVIQHGQPTQAELNDFSRKMVGAEFVFDEKLVQYIESIRARSQRILAIHNFLESVPVGERRNRLTDEQANIFMTISNEFGDLEKKFAPSMNLRRM